MRKIIARDENFFRTLNLRVFSQPTSFLSARFQPDISLGSSQWEQTCPSYAELFHVVMLYCHVGVLEIVPSKIVKKV